MIPLLLILLSGVSFGCEKVCKQKYVDEVPVDISCSSNCETVPGYIDTRNPHWIPVIEEKPTYVVEVSSGPACPKNPRVIPEPHCGEQLHTLRLYKNEYSGSWRCYGTHSDCEWLYDLAESLNEAHRRRVK